MTETSSPARRALVTGGAQRVGRALVEALSADGWAVAIHYNRSAEGAKNLAATLPSACAVGADFSDRSAIDSLFERASAGLGGQFSLLINCASTFEPDNAAEFSWPTWDVHMASNLEAPCRLAMHFAQQAEEIAPQPLSIINVIDQRVLKPNPQFFSYSIAKAGLAWATRTMAQQFAPAIRVNAILPGPTLRNARQDEESWQRQFGATLLARPSEPSEIVRAMRYLIAAGTVTGALMPVDSGQHLAWATPDIFGINE